MNSYNILIVEDEIDIARAIEAYLNNQGYKTFMAGNGIEGLEVLSKEEIHLAIVDVMMPKMDGITFVMKLREKYDFPVIMLSAKSEEVDYNGELTGAIIVQGIIPQYGGKVDVVDFRVVNKDAIDYINTNWNKGDTLRVAGKVNFSSKTIHEVEEVEFGEPIEKVRTISTKELIITSGSSSFDGDLAFDTDEIAKALQERQIRLNELKKQGSASKKNEGKKNTFANLGF